MSNEKFRELLDESYSWPDYYEFKFIVKMSYKTDVLDKLVGFSISETISKNGNYVSISARKLMKSSDEVLEVYTLMSKIEGILSL
ncbi:MAG TPA: DUF493 family protein [Bacteriovoracaceae bacterium]|nr:DUF493 family protein [Bacteriovoracaceae bacterium]